MRDGCREHRDRLSRSIREGVPVRRVIAATTIGLGLAAGAAGADALATQGAGPPSARSAQAYYPLPRPTPPAPTPAQPLRLMAPFPVVRIVGLATRRGARIQVLSVRAPTGSTIFVRCRRKGCSRRSRARGRGMRRAVRFRRFQRNLRAGTVVEVFVSRGNAIGKFTRFRIRSKRRRPTRTDLCLTPGAGTGSVCPDE